MKLGYLMLLVAVGAMLLVAPVAMAADKGGKGHDKGTFGKVTAATATEVSIELMAKKDAPAAAKKTVTATGDIFFKAEKGAEPAKIAITDVKVGDHVMVTLEGEKVTKVVVMPAGGGKHEKPAK